MLSVSRRQARLAAVASSVSLLGGVAAGCSTTQEKAETQKARAEHILQGREERQQAKKKDKNGKSGKTKRHGGGERQ